MGSILYADRGRRNCSERRCPARPSQAQPGPLPSCAFVKYDHITHRCRLYERVQYGFCSCSVVRLCVRVFFGMQCIYPMLIGRPAAVFPVTNKRLKHAAARAKWKRPHTGVHNMHSETHTHTHTHTHTGSFLVEDSGMKRSACLKDIDIFKTCWIGFSPFFMCMEQSSS